MVGQGDMTAPRLLPLEPRLFVNRGAEFEALDRALADARERGTPLLAVRTGLPGIGKTTLAVKWAYHVRDQFPDGQLYYELGGSTEPGAVPPADVLRHFLIQLGVDEERIPHHEGERAAKFRSITADKAVLVVLDDAATAAQVTAVLPSSSMSAVVVTSRKWLDDPTWGEVDEAVLEPLKAAFATELIGRAAGIDLAAEAAPVESLVTACGGLPLALTVAAGQLRRPRRRVAEVVESILAGRRAAASIEAVLDVAYRELSPQLAQTYRRLALHQGPDFGVPVVAMMLEVPVAEGRARLDELVDVNLLTAVGTDRYRFHPLVAEHARDRCAAGSSASECNQVRGRVVAWYVDHAISLARALSQRWWTDPARFERVKPAFDGPDAATQARNRFEVEHLNLLATLLQADDEKKHAEVLALSDALWPWLYNTDRNADLDTVQRKAVLAAEVLGHQVAVMRMRNQFGSAHEMRGAFSDAKREFQASLGIARLLGHVLGQQSNLEWLGIVLEQEGDLTGALDHFAASARMADEIDDPVQRARAIALGAMHTGRVLAALDRFTEALPELQNSLTYFTDHADLVNRARCLHLLAVVQRGLDRLDIAQPLAEQAVEIFSISGPRSQHVIALRTLADIEEIRGDNEMATLHRRQADDLS